MYYPQSQIKSNLYTNGGDYILSTTKEEYTGYFYELSNGKKYTGKNPQDGPNILLITSEKIITGTEQFAYEGIITLPEDYYVGKSLPPRSLPQSNPTIPTQQDYDLGAFQRFFCKKNNELIYLEINKDTYNLLQINSPTIAGDLYTAKYILWYLKGNKEQTYKANKALVSVLEQKEKWYGFSQYFKEDYLKYYLES